MLSNEIGMETDKAKINSLKLESYITTENRIESSLNTIANTLEKAYVSTNSKILDNNNKLIIESTHVKSKNLNSYKMYLDKYINKYTNVGINVIETSANIKNEIE